MSKSTVEMFDEIAEAVEDQGKALEEFKARYDGKVSRLEEELRSMSIKSTRIGAPGAGGRGTDEHKAALENYLRTGAGPEISVKGISTITGGGGYLVPEELAAEVYSLQATASPMRTVCNVVRARSGDYSQPVCLGGGAVSHVGEEDARPDTATPSFTEVKPSMGECYLSWPITQRNLDDSSYNIMAIVMDQASREIGAAQNAAFTSGNGTDKAKGFLAYAQASTDDGIRAFGTVQYVPTGTAGAFKTASATVSPADDLLTLIYKLRAGLRAGAAWMMNTSTLAAVRKWKDHEGNSIWQPSLQAGQPSALLGFPVIENEDMPSIGSGTVPIAFGNWKRAYTIVDRTLLVMRDPYSNKPWINLYQSAYYGGMLVDSEAVKLLKLSAT